MKFKQIITFLVCFLSFYYFQNWIIASTNTTETASNIVKNDEANSNINIENILSQVSLDNYIYQFFDFTLKKAQKNKWVNWIPNIIIVLSLIPTIFIVFYVLGWFLQYFLFSYFINYLHKRNKKTNFKKIIEGSSKGIKFLFGTWGLKLGLAFLESYFHFKLPMVLLLLNVLLILQSTFILKRILVAILTVSLYSLSSSKKQLIEEQVIPLSVGIIKVSIYIFGLLFCLLSLKINITPLLTSLGAFTFALGFAVKDSLSNLIAGFFLLMEDTFTTGDKLEIPGLGIGYIYEIGLRTTKISTFDHELIIVPNNILMNKEYKNFRLPDNKIRVVVNFSVAYGTNVSHLRETIFSALDKEKDNNILPFPKPSIDFLSMGDFSLDFRLVVFIDSYLNQFDKKIQLTEFIYNTLNEANIPIPFPTHTIQIEK